MYTHVLKLYKEQPSIQQLIRDSQSIIKNKILEYKNRAQIGGGYKETKKRNRDMNITDTNEKVKVQKIQIREKERIDKRSITKEQKQSNLYRQMSKTYEIIDKRRREALQAEEEMLSSKRKRDSYDPLERTTEKSKKR